MRFHQDISALVRFLIRQRCIIQNVTLYYYFFIYFFLHLDSPRIFLRNLLSSLASRRRFNVVYVAQFREVLVALQHLGGMQSSTIILLSLTAFLGVADPVHHEDTNFQAIFFRRANREGGRKEFVSTTFGNKTKKINDHSCFESYDIKICRIQKYLVTY